ncbi:MAG: hypothetical protein IJV68_04940 [Clostridia bacterium]|nr:hypothetical protein [Clostridia bacterium]
MIPTMIKLPNLSELSFTDEDHIYRLNGVIIPSVSAVMEPLSMAKYKGISESTLDRAANKGTSVHNAIENYIKFGIDDVPPEHRGYFDGFLDWLDEKKPVFVSSEFQCYHKLMMYGGTLDILSYIGDKLTLTDVKTTYTISEMTCRVQLEAYAQILASHGIYIEQKEILHLTPEGRGKKRYEDYPAKDAEAWRVFGSLKCVYDWISRH